MIYVSSEDFDSFERGWQNVFRFVGEGAFNCKEGEITELFCTKAQRCAKVLVTNIRKGSAVCINHKMERYFFVSVKRASPTYLKVFTREKKTHRAK